MAGGRISLLDGRPAVTQLCVGARVPRRCCGCRVSKSGIGVASAVCSSVSSEFLRFCEVATIDRYPLGGDSLSITRGIVSRVVLTRYAYASNKLLGVQIDAAINPVSWLWSIAQSYRHFSCMWMASAHRCAFVSHGVHWSRRQSDCFLPCSGGWWRLQGNSGGPAFANLDHGLVSGEARASEPALCQAHAWMM